MFSCFRPGSAWYSYACAALLGTIVIGNLGRWAVLDGDDSHRCGALLNEGSWNDPGKWHQWQPEGCFHFPLQKPEYIKCLSSPSPISQAHNLAQSEGEPTIRRALFIGDSIVRHLYGAAVRKMLGPDGDYPEWWGKPEMQHARQTFTITDGPHSVVMDFIWDAYLDGTETTYTTNFLSGESGEAPVSLLVLGTGLWHMRTGPKWNTKWTNTVDAVFHNLSSIQPMTSPVLRPWDTMDWTNGTMLGDGMDMDTSPSASSPSRRQMSHLPLADATIFIPVVEPIDSLLTAWRLRATTNARGIVANAQLREKKINAYPQPPLVVPWSLQKMVVQDESMDGLHYTLKMMDKQVELLLGWRCNDVADIAPGACCKRYSWVTPVQGMVLVLLAVLGPLSFLRSRLSPLSRLALPPASVAGSIAYFGFACVYLWLADRTPVFQKEGKAFDPYIVGAWMFGALVLGLATLRKGKDKGFLHREITDEWKGWMQIAILIYHFFGASKVSEIYNPVRVLVAAYLFMTGYGHFSFYYTKADFGFRRVVSVLVRLNLLSIVLPYTMDTDYLFYYFAPLVSWWYLSIYATMAIGHKYNQRTPFLLAKLLVSAGLMTALIKSHWIFDIVFGLLKVVARTNWDASEWSFRLGLDLLIVWAGMLSAFAFIKIKEAEWMDRPWFTIVRNASIGLSIAGLGWYAWFELGHSKFEYNGHHPYVSIVPILGFVVLRNATPTSRSYTSAVFCFIGQCSLETFILQFHGLLASDTHAILLVIPGRALRPINVILSVTVFIWLSHKVSGATGEMTEWIVGKKSTATLPTIRVEGIPGTPNSETALVADSEYNKEIELAEKALNGSEQQPGAMAWFGTLARENLGVKFGLIGLGLLLANWLY